MQQNDCRATKHYTRANIFLKIIFFFILAAFCGLQNRRATQSSTNKCATIGLRVLGKRLPNYSHTHHRAELIITVDPLAADPLDHSNLNNVSKNSKSSSSVKFIPYLRERNGIGNLIKVCHSDRHDQQALSPPGNRQAPSISSGLKSYIKNSQ